MRARASQLVVQDIAGHRGNGEQCWGLIQGSPGARAAHGTLWSMDTGRSGFRVDVDGPGEKTPGDSDGGAGRCLDRAVD